MEIKWLYDFDWLNKITKMYAKMQKKKQPYLKICFVFRYLTPPIT